VVHSHVQIAKQYSYRLHVSVPSVFLTVLIPLGICQYRRSSLLYILKQGVDINCVVKKIPLKDVCGRVGNLSLLPQSELHKLDIMFLFVLADWRTVSFSLLPSILLLSPVIYVLFAAFSNFAVLFG
jgi:hypothetical protein